MAVGSGEKEGGFSQSRRNFLAATAAALGALILGSELTKPNPFQEQARKLWEEYIGNPEEFIKKYPDGMVDGLIAGPNGVNLRDVPSAQGGKEGIVGYLKPNEPVGTALVFPNQPPNPDGPFLVAISGKNVVFLAKNQLVKSDQQANIKPPY